MPSINVIINEDEKNILQEVIQNNPGKSITVKELAKQAGQNPNRCRFVLEALIEEERVKKIPTKMYNPKYVRYRYEVVKDDDNN
jgi:DNA-binding Lrp family transcriptional regulator